MLLGLDLAQYLYKAVRCVVVALEQRFKTIVVLTHSAPIVSWFYG